MRDFLKNISAPAAEQQRIRAKCFHSTANFIEFKKEEIEQSIPERFEKIVRLYPDQLAVKTKDQQLSYAELNCAANRVAQAILAQRGPRQEPIALFFDHDARIIPAILGVLKAGKIYVPLDPSYPRERAAAILDDSQAELFLTDNKNHFIGREIARRVPDMINFDELDSHLSVDNPSSSVAPDSLALIVYTSGSTGQPKGVVQNHRNALHNAMRVANGLHICSADRITLFGSFSTGQGAPNAFGSLLNGATLYPIDIKREGIAGLADRIITERITIYLSAATIFRQFVHSLSGQEEFPDLRMIRLANEQVRKSDIELYKRHFAPNCIFANFLSGTETGNLCQFYIDKETEISGSFVPVGYSVDDMEIKVLNDSGEEVGFDHVGEIAVTSPYLALGYWRRPDLTQEGFLADPAGGSKKTYRTGDMGLMTPDGCLQHLGRKAFRVKIRGFRVELEEVEASLAQDPTVKEAAVDAREDEAGNTQLIAYIVCAEERKPTVSALRRFLGATLPEYMVPSVFVFLNSLPLTPLGKVDRRSLPPPGRDRPELDTVFVGPGTEVEASLAEIWQQVLHVDSVGIHDNFFDLGGNSVRLAEVNRKASELLRTEISLIEMFRYPTISSLAQLLTPTVQQKEQDVLEQSYDRAKIRRALRAGRSTNRKEPDQ